MAALGERSFFWDKPEGELTAEELERFQYSAQDLASFYESMYTTGICPAMAVTSPKDNPEQYLGSSLACTAGEGLQVVVSPGPAMIKGRGYLASLPVPFSVAAGKTTDILLRLDLRQNLPEIALAAKQRPSGVALEGNLLHEALCYELAIATVAVPEGSIQVTPTMITDQRLNTAEHPVDGKPLSGLMRSIPAVDTLGIWEDYTRLETYVKSTWASFLEGSTAQWADFLSGRQGEFERWFQDLQHMLDGDVAAKLAGEIATLKGRVGQVEGNAPHWNQAPYAVTAALTPLGVLELSGDLPAEKEGLTVQFVSPAAATDSLQAKFAGSETLYPILSTSEGKEPVAAGAWDQGVPVSLTVSGGSCFFKGGGQGFPPGWNEKGQGIAWDDIAKNSPVVQREYGKIEDGLQALPGPDALPEKAAQKCAVSPDGDYLTVACSYAPPYLFIYKRSGGTYVKLTDPDVMPTGPAFDCAFSPNGVYLAVAHNGLPYITIYKRDGDTFTKLPGPSVLPSGSGHGCSFSPNGKYLAVAFQTSSPYLIIYRRDGDTFTKLPNPDIPPGEGMVCSFSPDSSYLAVGHRTSPFVTIYKNSGDSFFKLPNPDVLPTSSALGCSFSPNEDYLAVAHFQFPFITIYKRSGDAYAKLSNPEERPTSTGLDCTFSPDGNYLVVMYGGAAPYIIIYKRSGDVFAKLPNPEILPTGDGYGCAFSADGTFLAVTYYTSPCVTVYLNEQKTYIHTLNEMNKEYFAYAPKGKIGVAKESKAAGEPVKATLFPALYNLTDEGGN